MSTFPANAGSKPLRAVVEAQFSADAVPACFTKTFANFYRIAAELGEPVIGMPPTGHRIQLESAQTRSFWILWHWWKTFREDWEVPAEDVSVPSPTVPVRNTAEGKSYEFKSPSTHSDYFSSCLPLFELEFCDLQVPNFENTLYELRRDAALHSACYHTTIASCDRADSEIARQAVIFKQASHTIIWMNQISNWDGLSNAIDWMSAVYLGLDSLQPRPALDKPTGLFEEYDFYGDFSIDNVKPSGWFSSLWTLQEICLRPDMWLCNSHWTILTTGNCIPIALNTIVALTGACKGILEELSALSSNLPHLDLSRSYLLPNDRMTAMIAHGRYHRGFLELVELFDRTGMRDLHMIKKDYILLLGSQRYCESQRDHAIMSVLGATDWLLLQDRGTLVHGQYHVEVVREVARKIGATFFNSLSFRKMAQPDALSQGGPSPSGSLMPFEYHSGPLGSVETKMLLNWEFGDSVDHPSVGSWIINQNGSVTIPEAAILTSTGDATDGPILAAIWLTYEVDDKIDPQFNQGGIEQRRQRTVDLKKCINKSQK
ncbi:hypothetical protein DHEL01_v210917 [Diaporthe helianthi]|uniref:Heterokaryon incompatibility domain-containing protein n=1 Tax=Diaporthe helianthi TaxID=158607 RepID=A0A2P5HKC7_DIAHE|nr:hypothetical protein DHEL01_v210917 [Diaporthe helianthi]